MLSFMNGGNLTIKGKFPTVVKNVQDKRRKVFPPHFPLFLPSSPFSIFTFPFPVWAQTSRWNKFLMFFFFRFLFPLSSITFPFSHFPLKTETEKYTPLSFLYGLECSGRFFSNIPRALVFLNTYLLGKLFGDYPWWEYACCWGLSAYKVNHFFK